MLYYSSCNDTKAYFWLIFSSYIKNPIPGYVKLVVSVEKYCVFLKWSGVYVIKYNICVVMNG